MTKAFGNPKHAAFWEAARRGEPVDWKGFFAGYGVAVDWPVCAFYEEMMEAFPGAKVILTLRDPERWYVSVSDTIYAIRKLSAGPARPAMALASLFAPGITGMVRLADEIVWKGTFEDRFEDRRHAIETFKRHNAEVRRVPPDRLLVYDVKEGWAPLCDFFGVEVPDRPFPHLNDTRQMRRRLLGLVALSAAAPTLTLVCALVAVAYLLRRAGSRTP
jgi:hypothetical protein